MAKQATGSRILDKMLDGGYDKDIITTLYGPAGTGKTVLCILCASVVARTGKKVIYIDTEGGFAVDRLKQVAKDYQKILSSIYFLKPTSFGQQQHSFEKLRDMVNEKIGLVVVDSVSMLYRLELGKGSEAKEANREMARQLSYLTDISRNWHIPVLVTNQVYADFEERDKVNMVGGDLLKYASKCLIELQVTPQNNRKAILRKHRSLEQERSITFRIVETGILGTKE